MYSTEIVEISSLFVILPYLRPRPMASVNICGPYHVCGPCDACGQYSALNKALVVIIKIIVLPPLVTCVCMSVECVRSVHSVLFGREQFLRCPASFFRRDICLNWTLNGDLWINGGCLGWGELLLCIFFDACTYEMIATISFGMPYSWIGQVAMISEIDNCPHHFRFCFGCLWYGEEFLGDDTEAD